MDEDLALTMPSVHAALSGLDDALASLIEALGSDELHRVEANGLVEVMRAFESVRNRLSLADHHLVGECERREVADLFNLRNTKALMVDRLHVSDLEARRRVRAAAMVGERTSMTGEVREPVLVMLAEAQRSGAVSPEQVAIVEEAYEEISRKKSDPATLALVDSVLTHAATQFGPRELRRSAAAMVYTYDQDGKEPGDARLEEQRRFKMGTAHDGSVRGSFVLTPEVGASLVAVLGALSKPRPDPPAPDGGHVADAHRDSRTLEQRQHDALGELCARALRSGGLADSGGVPASVVVTISADDLLGRTGAGETSFGNPVSVTQLLRLAGEADVYPTVLTRSGEPLCLGRSRRIASRSQSMALVARDGGCSFPGCAHPPEWCDRHHVIAWIDGGLTDLNNLTLLCRYHHTRFLGKGWSCRINPDGIPEWTPPRWQDPSQTPMIHHRILRLQLQRRIRERARSGDPVRDDPPWIRERTEKEHTKTEHTDGGSAQAGELEEPTDGPWATDEPDGFGGFGHDPEMDRPRNPGQDGVQPEPGVGREPGVEPELVDPERDREGHWWPVDGPTDRWAA